MSLVEKGAYASPAVFLQLAVENQLIAEESHTSHWAPVVVSTETPIAAPPNVPPALVAKDAPRPTKDGASERLLHRLQQELKFPVLVEVTPCPPMFRLARDWPFGQINRLFPLKLICRHLLATTSEGQWPDTPSALRRLSVVARDIGLLLGEADLEFGRGRDQALATSLPTAEEGADNRFLSQFGGKLTSAGPRPGAVCTYQLACFDGERFGLTAHGIEFARLPNPLLDSPTLATKLLSPEEQLFFVELIRTSVAGERAALSEVMGAISMGINRFEDVVAAIRPHAPPRWSLVFLKSQISGAIARAHELGLLGKQRQGRSVDYSLTAAGIDALRAFTQGGADGPPRQ